VSSTNNLTSSSCSVVLADLLRGEGDMTLL
jgi:hypothetical protein